MAPAIAVPAQSFKALDTVQTYSMISAQAASNSTAIVHAERQKDVAVTVSFKMTAASTDNIGFAFARSPDGVSTDTAAASTFVWSVPANGTTTVQATTNISCGALGGFRLLWVTNAAATAIVTNMTVKQTYKIGAS